MTWGVGRTDGSRGHETEVELTFEPAAAGTRMRLVQRLFETVESRDRHEHGWTSSFNDLDRLLRLTAQPNASVAAAVHAVKGRM